MAILNIHTLNKTYQSIVNRQQPSFYEALSLLIFHKPLHHQLLQTGDQQPWNSYLPKV